MKKSLALLLSTVALAGCASTFDTNEAAIYASSPGAVPRKAYGQEQRMNKIDDASRPQMPDGVTPMYDPGVGGIVDAPEEDPAAGRPSLPSPALQAPKIYQAPNMYDSPYGGAPNLYQMPVKPGDIGAPVMGAPLPMVPVPPPAMPWAGPLAPVAPPPSPDGVVLFPPAVSPQVPAPNWDGSTIIRDIPVGYVGPLMSTEDLTLLNSYIEKTRTGDRASWRANGLSYQFRADDDLFLAARQGPYCRRGALLQRPDTNTEWLRQQGTFCKNVQGNWMFSGE
jgi:hypothetical protein